MTARLVYPISVMITGVLLALIAAGILGFGKADFGDAEAYLASARAIVQGQAYPRESPVGDRLFRAPGYPLLIAFTWLFAPYSIAAIKLVQAVLFGLLCACIYAIAFRVLRDQRVACISGLLVALNPLLLVMATDVQTEIPHATLVAAAVFFLLLSADERRSHWAALAGLCLGWGSLFRPSTLPVGLGLLVGYLGMMICLVRKRWVALRLTGVALVAMLGVVLPWTVSNYQATGGLILITDADGFAFWLGNHPLNLALYQGHLTSAEHSLILSQVEAPRMIELGGGSAWYSALSLPERSAFWRELGLRYVTEDPLRSIQLWLYKAWGYWQPWLQPFGYSRWIVVSSGLVMVTLYALAVPGAVMLWRKQSGRPLVAMVLFLAVASTAVHVLTLSSVRYRLPFVDPYLSVFAACTLSSMAGRLHLFSAQTP